MCSHSSVIAGFIVYFLSELRDHILKVSKNIFGFSSLKKWFLYSLLQGMKENVCRGNGVVILGGEARVQSTGWRVLPPTAGTKEGSGGPCNVSLIPVPAARALDFLVSEPRSRLGPTRRFPPWLSSP